MKVRREGDTLYLTFMYDPDVVSAVKTLAGRTWDKKRRAWAIPYTVESYDAIARIAARFQLHLQSDPLIVADVSRLRAAQAQAIAIKHVGDADVDYRYVTEPYAHQRAGLAYLAAMQNAGLTWDMGTGKTKTAIDFCEWYGRDWSDSPTVAQAGPDLRVLVLAPNGVVDKWGQEVELHAKHDDYVLLRAPASLLTRSRQLGTARYSILNHEAISHDGPLTKAILDRTWDVVVVDESHRFKNPRANRTKRLLKVKATCRIILTGTPLTNSPEDLWAQLTYLRPGILGSWWTFQQRYLNRDFFGNVVGVRSDMVAELQAKVESVTYRVRKEEVLDLPPKVYEDIRVTMNAQQAKAYRAMKDELHMLLESGEMVVAHNVLTQLLRLTQVTAGLYGQGDTYMWDEKGAKVQELDRLLDDDLRNEQVVVFGVYRRELEEIAARYQHGHTTGIVYGGVRPEERALLIKQFQEGRRRLLFVQAHSGGIGIDLTAAQYAVYHTRSWSLEDYQQSQDRLHRIGQRGTVTIIHLVADGTVDEQITRALAAKLDLARRLTGDDARALAREVLTRKP